MCVPDRLKLKYVSSSFCLGHFVQFLPIVSKNAFSTWEIAAYRLERDLEACFPVADLLSGC
jgi:hypothetical protein